MTIIPKHPALPHLFESYLCVGDLDLVGITRIQIFRGITKPEGLLWEFEHKDYTKREWIVKYDYLHEHEVGDVVHTGEITRDVNFKLKSKKFKYAWIKVYITTYPEGCRVISAFNDEFLYAVNLVKRNCITLTPMWDDTPTPTMREILSSKPTVKRRRSGLHRHTAARRG